MKRRLKRWRIRFCFTQLYKVEEQAITEKKEDTILLQASQQYKVCQDESPSKWSNPVTTDDISGVRESSMPSKTCQQMEWCKRIWADWTNHRKKYLEGEEECANVLMENTCEMTSAAMNYWLCRFILEIRKQKSEYPP